MDKKYIYKQTNNIALTTSYMKDPPSKNKALKYRKMARKGDYFQNHISNLLSDASTFFIYYLWRNKLKTANPIYYLGSSLKCGVCLIGGTYSPIDVVCIVVSFIPNPLL